MNRGSLFRCQEALQSKLHRSAETLLSKNACSVIRSAIMARPENIVSGFRGTGLFPPYLVNIERRMGVYSNGGAKRELGNAEWLKRKHEMTTEVRDGILTLPVAASEKGKKPRLTVDISGRLITKEMLLEENI
ncbi:hypothetical protein BBJ28_00023216 [Nothophytophthora sp. Chile5]|nr:hypothetical protein BBJ28_00023216 [Nothophytophthora sp. Chile5]